MIGGYTLTAMDWAILIVFAIWVIAVMHVWRGEK